MTALNLSLERWLTAGGGPEIAAVTRSIRADLERVEEQLEAWSRSENPVTAEVSRYVLRKRGKRLRPALVLLSSRLFTDGPGEGVFLASLVELLHTASLIHDDIIDNAGTRRGDESVHAKWGPNITVLLGDHLYIKSIGLSLRSRHERVIGLVADVSSRMIEGELDEYALSGDLGITEAQYMDVIDKKTAVLFSACCRMGAILGSARDDEERDLSEYGRNLGLCFQIVDDLLDFTGDESVMGKPVLSDLGEGRITLPLIRALAGDGRERRERLAGLVRRRNIAAADQGWLAEALASSGALSYAEGKAQELAARSVESLARFPGSGAKQALAGLSGFVLARRR